MEPGLNLVKSPNPDLTLPFQNLLGSLLWIVRCTRPDLYFAVAYTSQFNTAYSKHHYDILLRILVFMHSTVDKKLVLHSNIRFPSHSDPTLGILPIQVYTDSDWASCKQNRKSVSGSVVMMCGSPVCWHSKRQNTVALSSCEAEYMAITDATKEALYVYNLMSEFHQVATPILLHCDNQGAAYLSTNTVNNQRSKHIDIRYHFIRDWIAKGIVSINYVNTSDNVADIFTKALPKEMHCKHSETLLGQWRPAKTRK